MNGFLECPHCGGDVGARENRSGALHRIFAAGMVLSAIFFLTGCGPSPEEVAEGLLKQQTPELQNAALDGIFAEQIAENSGATVFYRSGQELIMVNGGLATHTDPPEEMLKPVSFMRTYHVFRVRYALTPSSARFAPLKKISQAPYTYQTVMTLSARRETATGNEVPGLTVHALTPVDFAAMDHDRKEKWCRSNLATLPADACDHAIAIASVEFDGAKTNDVRNFAIKFNGNTKKWELENNAQKVSLPPAPAVNDVQISGLLSNRQYRRTILKKDGLEQKLYLRADDRETIKEGVTKLREKLELLKNSIAPFQNESDKFVAELKFFPDGELVRHYERLKELNSVKSGSREAFRKLVKNQWHIGEHDLRLVCNSCDGSGKRKCNDCKNTGICQICNGTGVRIFTDTTYRRKNAVHGKSQWVTRNGVEILERPKVLRPVETKREVPCAKECPSCNGQRKLCLRCNGQTGFLNRKGLDEAIEKERDALLAEIDRIIAEIDRLLAEISVP